MGGEAIAALIGALVGGGLAAAASFAHEAWRDSRRAKRLARAIAGEVRAILEIAELRKYHEGIKEYARNAHAGADGLLVVRVRRNYFSVTEANLQEIGLLKGELPSLVPRFLTLTKSVFEDFEVLAGNELDHLEPAELAVFYDDLSQVFDAARVTGKAILVEVSEQYGPLIDRDKP